MSEQETTHRNLERAVILRALKDPAFRAKLLANPREAIASVAGVSLSEGVQVKVVEQAADAVYLVLRAVPAGDGELAEADLARVAGGFGNFTSTCIVGGTPIKSV